MKTCNWKIKGFAVVANTKRRNPHYLVFWIGGARKIGRAQKADYKGATTVKEAFEWARNNLKYYDGKDMVGKNFGTEFMARVVLYHTDEYNGEPSWIHIIYKLEDVKNGKNVNIRKAPAD